MEDQIRKERRHYSRAEASVDVLYMADSGNIPTYSCTSRDINVEGMGIITGIAMEPGSTALVSFNLPNYANMVISPATVIWTRKRYAFCASGLRFTQLTDHDKQALATYITKQTTHVA